MKWWIIIIWNETILNYAATQQFGFNIATLFECTVEISSKVHCDILMNCPVKRLTNSKQSIFDKSTEIQCLQISVVILSIRKIRFKSQGTSGLSILAWISSTSNVVEVYIHVVVWTWRVHSWRNRCQKKKRSNNLLMKLNRCDLTWKRESNGYQVGKKKWAKQNTSMLSKGALVLWQIKSNPLFQLTYPVFVSCFINGNIPGNLYWASKGCSGWWEGQRSLLFNDCNVVICVQLQCQRNDNFIVIHY